MQGQSFLFSGFMPVYYSYPRPSSPSVAILIDGDNIHVSEAQLMKIMQEAECMGEVTTRRVYGNWAANTKNTWNDIVLKYAFKPCHHIHGRPGKNATDIALSVDAMDLLYQGITIFFLVSSDSDYTPLIHRLRTANCQVIGVGNPATNTSLLAACNRFITLTPTEQAQTKKTPQKKTASTKVVTEKKSLVPQKNTSTATKTISEKIAKPLDDPTLTQEITLAFDAVSAEQHRESILLIDVAKALKEHTSLRAKDYGKNSWLFVLKERTDLFSFQQIERDGKLLDEIRRRENSTSAEEIIPKVELHDK